MKFALATALLFVLLFCSCDSASLPACQLATDEVYTNTVAYTITEFLNPVTVAFFEFEQTVKTYETSDCEPPAADVNDVKLIIRNITNCTLSLEYNGSVILGQDGWSFEGDATLSPQGVVDEGVIQRGGVQVDGAQIVLRGQGSQSGCQ